MFKKYQEHILVLEFSQDQSSAVPLLDDKRFLPISKGPLALEDFIAPASRSRLAGFLKKLTTHDFAFSKNIHFTRNDNSYPFFLFGVLKEEKAFAFALQSPRHFFTVYDEFISIINEQGRLLRDSQKNAATSNNAALRHEYDSVLQDLMELNNDLANMQREFARQNAHLTLSEKQFRDLVTVSPNAQIVLSPEGKILFRNPIAELLTPSFQQHLESLPSQEAFTATEEIKLHTNGEDAFFDMRIAYIEWEGNPAKLISLQDISKRKEIERTKEDVHRITQHNLISPLNAITNIPHILINDPTINEENKKMLAHLSSAGGRMTAMVRLSLDLFKMEVGTYQFSPQPVDIISTFNDVLVDFESPIDASGTKITITFDGKPINTDAFLTVPAEATLLYSLFSNLLLNAVEASNPDDTVSIRLQGDSKARVAIHNPSPVPAQIRDSFFDKYVTSGKSHGTGLGTYSARLIADALGGTIAMRTSETEGTTIEVTLPLGTSHSKG